MISSFVVFLLVWFILLVIGYYIGIECFPFFPQGDIIAVSTVVSWIIAIIFILLFKKHLSEEKTYQVFGFWVTRIDKLPNTHGMILFNNYDMQYHSEQDNGIVKFQISIPYKKLIHVETRDEDNSITIKVSGRGTPYVFIGDNETVTSSIANTLNMLISRPPNQRYAFMKGTTVYVK